MDEVFEDHFSRVERRSGWVVDSRFCILDQRVEVGVEESTGGSRLRLRDGDGDVGVGMDVERSSRRSVMVFQRASAALSAALWVSGTAWGDEGGSGGVGREFVATMAFCSLMRTPSSESKAFYMARLDLQRR